ncbi:hypothetical protein DERF_008441 [Dermatophagoides farinae]|uniref:Uncharacterized protein n=1 Tax=Dermatophagoides farinae TaxID=6954 RepID=A0A922L960_DERFA|nr:hypothetical protein DERF_008441 [Dermatophagoides farinae]
MICGLAQWRCGNNNKINGNGHFSNSKPPQPPQPPLPLLMMSMSTSSKQSKAPLSIGPARIPITTTNNGSQQQNGHHLFHNNNRASWIQLPDLSQCHSRWLLQLNSIQNINYNYRNDIWHSILANMQHSPLYGGDINQLIILLENWSLRYFHLAVDGNRFKNFSNQITGLDTIFEIISELLNRNHLASWLDLPDIKRETAALNLMDITMKYSTLYCLNYRSKNTVVAVTASTTTTTTTTSTDSKETIKQSQYLIMSCFSISKLIHEFQLNWNKLSEQLQQSQMNVSEFKYELLSLPSTSTSTTMDDNKIKVFLILNNVEEQSNIILTENIYFSMLIPINLENYFQLSNMDIFTNNDHNGDDNNGHHDQMAESFLNLIQIESTESLLQDHDDHMDTTATTTTTTFINGQIIKFIRFNDEQILPIQQQQQQQQHQTSSSNINKNIDVGQSETSSSFSNHYAFEIIFKHLVDYDNNNDHDDGDVGDNFIVVHHHHHHQCVHWDETVK